MHLLKIAWLMLSWRTCENIANESVGFVLCCDFAHMTLIQPYIYCVVFGLSFPLLVPLWVFFLAGVWLWGWIEHTCYEYNICSEITVRSAALLVFTNTRHWPLHAPAPGYRAVHHGPLPQAFRIQGGRCLQGDSDQTESMHCYQSICTSVCTVLYKSQQS